MNVAARREPDGGDICGCDSPKAIINQDIESLEASEGIEPPYKDLQSSA